MGRLDVRLPLPSLPLARAVSRPRPALTFTFCRAESRGPYLVVLKDRGQTLRFYKADRVRISKELIRELLTEELWRETPPWKSNFAPGGKRYVPIPPSLPGLPSALPLWLQLQPRFAAHPLGRVLT